MNKAFVTGVIVLCVIGGVLFAQSETQARTIEDLYLSQELELQILRGQALSDDPDMKRLALQDIRAGLESGRINSDSDGVFIILETLAAEGTSRQIRSAGSVVNNYPDVRREAVELLGQVGTPQARQTLLKVVTDDPEPMVLAEAAYALGTIGSNENNVVSDHLVQLLHRENTSETPDNNLAFATILALERLSENVGGLADPEVVNVLIETAGSPYIQTVRIRAVQAVVNIRDDQ